MRCPKCRHHLDADWLRGELAKEKWSARKVARQHREARRLMGEIIRRVGRGESIESVAQALGFPAETATNIHAGLTEHDPHEGLAGLNARAKRECTRIGALTPEAVARALTYKNITRQTRGIGAATYAHIERWLETRGIIRVSEDENFFEKSSKKILT